MKNIKLLIITLLFSSLLMGCGMKGPLYRAPVAQPTPEPAMENKEKSQVEQDNITATTEELTNCAENTTATDKQQAPTVQGNATTATTEEQINCSENTTAANKQQVVTEQDKSEKKTARD